MSTRKKVRIAGRSYTPGADHGVSALLTSASWVLQRLPGQVLDDQRKSLVETLGQAQDLVIEVHTRASVILVRDGDRPLIKIPAT